jgi:protein gp37
MELAWAADIRDQCVAAGVPFFLKQLGGFPDKRGGEKAVLDGQRWHQMPPEPPRWVQNSI